MSGEKNNGLASRLRAFRLSIGLTLEKASDAFRIPLSTYKRYESGVNEPGSEEISGMMGAGLNANWLLSGDGPMVISKALEEFISALPPSEKYKITHQNSVGTFASEPTPPPHGFVLVPRYDVSASMGSGAVIHSEQIVDHLAFRAEWVRTELSANPNNLVLISAIGDSMEPTLRAGDLLLIDRSATAVKQDAVYAFATNGDLRVKRMQLKIDGSVVVKSDNPQYDAEFLTAEHVAALRIVGRVVWSGRRM